MKERRERLCVHGRKCRRNAIVTDGDCDNAGNVTEGRETGGIDAERTGSARVL